MRILLTNGHRNVGFQITRALGTAGHEVIAADCRSLPFGARSRYACAFARLPAPSAPAYPDQLLELVRRLRPEVLIPLGSVAAVSSRLEEFQCETGVLVADPNSVELVADKARLYSLCEELGIPHPRVLGMDSETVDRQLPAADGALPRAVIKPRRDFGAGQGLKFIHRHQGLEDTWRRLEDQFGDLVATEFVPGPVAAQSALHLLFDLDSRLIEFFVLRKLRQWPVATGITAAAVSTHELELIEQMLPLFRRLRWRGPVEVELKRHAHTGAACVLEINPRFSGTIGFSLAAGVDLPGSMARASLGHARARALSPYYPAGLYYWNPWPYVRSVASDLWRPARIGEGLRGLAMPLTRRTVGSPYTWRDPWVLLAKPLIQITEALDRRRPSQRCESAR